MEIKAADLVALVEAFTERQRIAAGSMWEEAHKAAQEAERLRLELEQARSQLAAAVFQSVYDGTAHDREQMEQDAALGRLVRQMPKKFGLINEGHNFPWEAHDETGCRFAHRTPEEALRAAGVREQKEGD